MARRIRTHANPLSYPDPIKREEWTKKLSQDKPLYVDMGCGKGDFIIECAKNNPNSNNIGIEVRQAMCEEVNKKINKLNLSNAICISGNASISLTTLFKENEVQELYINFPDPWKKERHLKRLLIKNDVVKDLYRVLNNNGIIFLMTDIEEIFLDFKEKLQKEFKTIPYQEKNEKTYWEKWHIKKGNTLHKQCFTK